MSMKLICVRFSLFGSLTWTGRPGRSVAAKLRIVRRLSRGGVGAEGKGVGKIKKKVKELTKSVVDSDL